MLDFSQTSIKNAIDHLFDIMDEADESKDAISLDAEALIDRINDLVYDLKAYISELDKALKG